MRKNEDEVKAKLDKLRCHFTWELLVEDTQLPDLEIRILDEIDFLDTKYNVGIHNLLAYVKHLKGQNQEALGSLKEAEDLIQQEHDTQSEVRSLVTWGNYAWLYYHMGRLAEAQVYLDKVENARKKFEAPSRYRVECPQMDCEEGWALLKCGGKKNYERAKACFEKALAADPENPEFSTGFAITTYRLDSFNKATEASKAFCLQPLQEAIRLNPEDAYIKALLALKLQDIGQEDGEKYIEEALSNMSSQTYVFRYAAKFYRRKGCLEKALRLLKMALRATPSSAFLHHQIGLCYRAQMIEIKRAANWQCRGQDRENVDRMVRLAIPHFQFALEQKPTFEVAYIHLASMYIEAGDYERAEDTYQKVFCLKSLEEEKLQEIHFHYGQFQEFQKKSEINAIIHYLKAVKIEKATLLRDKSINSLEKLASRKLSRKASDVESLSILGFIYKVKGEMNKALEYYERALRLAAGLGNSETLSPAMEI